MLWLLRKLKRRSFSSDEIAFRHRDAIHRAVPITKKLPKELEERLLRMTEIFAAEKNFEGAGGFVITDEVRLTIAASACLLLVGKWKELSDPLFEELATIIVYPGAYASTRETKGAGGVVREERSERLGESWGDGTVVLSWADAKRGALDVKDGSNVVVHEFAHQLDQADGEADGVPELERASLYGVWSDVLGHEFHALQEAHGKRAVLDHYGATNPAEFFAVATESFFEKARQMQSKHPELYDALSRYYGVDPASWSG